MGISPTKLPPRPTYPTNPNISPRPTYPTHLVGEMPIRSEYRAGLKSDLIKPLARTARHYNGVFISSQQLVRALQLMTATAAGIAAGAYTRPLFSSISAVLVPPPRVPLSNRLGGNHALTASH